MTDIVTVEIQCLMPVIVSRRRESCCNAHMFQHQFGVEHTSYYLDIAHNY